MPELSESELVQRHLEALRASPQFKGMTAEDLDDFVTGDYGGFDPMELRAFGILMDERKSLEAK